MEGSTKGTIQATTKSRHFCPFYALDLLFSSKISNDKRIRFVFKIFKFSAQLLVGKKLSRKEGPWPERGSSWSPLSLLGGSG